MVSTEVMSTELFKNSRTGFSDLSIIPLSLTHTHTHTDIQYTVDTIALDSYKDVCGFCL